jgi:hypothetical protein
MEDIVHEMKLVVIGAVLGRPFRWLKGLPSGDVLVPLGGGA